MEEELTVDELFALLNSMNNRLYENNKFLAALKGVDLDEGRKNEKFESIQQRAAAELEGKTEEEYVFNMIGIEIEEDD